MQFLDFEKPLEELYAQLEKLETMGENSQVDVTAAVKELHNSIKSTKAQIYENLTPWQRVQLSRHPARPYTNFYISKIFDQFTELFGDRQVKDDKAIVAGMAYLNDSPVMVMGHQKGTNAKTRQQRNFGMANPEGYRKALRLMKMAEKFGHPVITFIDTPGAYPGLEAEERGQAEAIARNLFEMVNLKVPIICIIIGEGASGGALGIGIGDKVAMLENTWYTVISPENCSTILWHTWDYKVKAAEQLHLTSKDMNSFGLVDDVIKEPLGGAHAEPDEMAELLKKYLEKTLAELLKTKPDKLITNRIEKFSAMGHFKEYPEEELQSSEQE